ncbi:unnamed protein product, partial [Porites lobata]
MAQFSRILAAAVLLMLVVQAYCMQCGRVQYKCCGHYSYTPSSHVCCSGKVVQKPSQCCGRESYNPRYQACCGGNVYDINKQEEIGSDIGHIAPYECEPSASSDENGGGLEEEEVDEDGLSVATLEQRIDKTVPVSAWFLRATAYRWLTRWIFSHNVSSSLQGVQLIFGWYGLIALSFVMPLTKQEQSKNAQATGD